MVFLLRESISKISCFYYFSLNKSLFLTSIPTFSDDKLFSFSCFVLISRVVSSGCLPIMSIQPHFKDVGSQAHLIRPSSWAWLSGCQTFCYYSQVTPITAPIMAAGCLGEYLLQCSFLHRPQSLWGCSYSSMSYL